MSWDPNASRTRYPGKLELFFPGRKPALAGFAIQPNGSMSSEYPLTGPAIGPHLACFYPPEAAARARSELELKIDAVEAPPPVRCRWRSLERPMASNATYLVSATGLATVRPRPNRNSIYS
jgi:hypothetical protein